jgi:hypothetical protein
MSILSLAQQTREKVITQSSRAILKLVPETSQEVQETRRFFAMFLSLVAVIGFLALLLVNTLLAQDAFVLSELKSDAKIIADEREAISREIELYSSPQALANQAALLGMSPSENPTFLDISPVIPTLSDQDGVTRG